MRVHLDISIDDNDIDGIIERFREVVEKTIAAQIGKLKAQRQHKQEVPRTPQGTTPGGVVLPDSERIEAADLRTALLMGKLPEDSGILLDVKTVAKLLNVSDRTVYRLSDLTAIPAPIKIGTLVRWRLTEILEWVDNGCPSGRQSQTVKTRRR